MVIEPVAGSYFVMSSPVDCAHPCSRAGSRTGEMVAV